MGDYKWVAEAKGFEPGIMQFVHVDGNSILLVNVDGQIYALSDFCTHSKCYLHNGKLRGKVITCPCHFAEFDVTTGVVLRAPAKQPLPMYPVRVEGNDVYIEI